MLASGDEPDARPMHHERMNELLDAIGEDDSFMPMVAMVLKQRSRYLSPEVAQELVIYLLDQDSRDVYAFIAAAGPHPRLLTEFPTHGSRPIRGYAGINFHDRGNDGSESQIASQARAPTELDQQARGRNTDKSRSSSSCCRISGRLPTADRFMTTVSEG